MVLVWFQELEVIIDVEYQGGFQLAVDVDLVFGKSAYLSVTVTHLRGTARIQLSRLPFTHWSFAFLEVGADVTLPFCSFVPFFVPFLVCIYICLFVCSFCGCNWSFVVLSWA